MFELEFRAKGDPKPKRSGLQTAPLLTLAKPTQTNTKPRFFHLPGYQTNKHGECGKGGARGVAMQRRVVVVFGAVWCDGPETRAMMIAVCSEFGA